MGLSRISTFNLHQTTLNDVSKAQVTLSNLQNQISSGLKSDTFAGLNGQVEQYMAVELTLNRSLHYQENNLIAAARLQSTEKAVDQIIDVATTLKTLLISRRNQSTANNLAFFQQIDGMWKTVAGQLNSSLEGRYLFSGTRTDTPPVDETNFPTLLVEDTPDDHYYQGTDDDITIRADDSFELTYNVRANQEGFQKIYAAFALAKEGDDTDSDEKLVLAYDTLTEGIEDMVKVLASSTANRIALEQTNQRHDSFKLYWKGVREQIVNTDLVGATTQVAVNQGVIQAAFQVFARISQLKLSDFLR